jgi:hypothetical protein
MRRLTTLFWVFSLVLFLVVLIYTNLYLPTFVNVIGENSLLKKSDYFYIAIGIATLMNGSLLILGGAFSFVPSFLMPVPKRNEWTEDERKRRKLYLDIKGWLKGLGVCFNLFLITSLIDIYDTNDNDIIVPTAWLFVLISLLTLGWLVTYYFWFNRIPTEEELQRI